MALKLIADQRLVIITINQAGIHAAQLTCASVLELMLVKVTALAKKNIIIVVVG